MTENGKTRRIPVLEVTLRRLTNDAMRGDPKAVKLLLALVDRYSDSPESAIRLGDLLAEDQAIFAEYLSGPVDFASTAPSKSDQKVSEYGV